MGETDRPAISAQQYVDRYNDHGTKFNWSGETGSFKRYMKVRQMPKSYLIAITELII